MAIPPRTNRYDSAADLASRLRHRVVIETPVRSSDGQGGSSISWNSVATVWSEIRSVRSGSAEPVVAGKRQAEVTYEITLRYRNDVSAKERIRYGERLFNIRSVDNIDGADVILVLRVEEGVVS